MSASHEPTDRVLPGLLTADLPGTGGQVRVRPKDFSVEEIPLYEPSGRGAHTFFQIEKRGIDTPRAIRLLAEALRVPAAAFSFAGLKDAQAVARQILSIEGLPPERVLRARVVGVRVLWARRHPKRLQIGELRGNRFAIRIRGVLPGALERANAILEVLARRGMPNGFGAQRFGYRQANHLLGQAMVRRDWAAFCEVLLGRPAPDEPDASRRAREAYQAGDLRSAQALWPPALREERAVLRALGAGAPPAEAALRLPQGVRRLYGAAYQSYLFNRLLSERLPTIDRLETGDLAIIHASDAFFLVEDAAREQERAERLEISPSGPLYGFKVRLAREAVGDREHGLLRAEGITRGDFRGVPGAYLVGERRAFRVPLEGLAVRQEGDDLLLRFALPRGAYATSLLREVIKREVA
ncbi:MAG: tRNA pseudouridine(13) synthase TruD [Chloroflexi bacterium]|nr:tRNA pseudouridine(13) synthase TruD [Chloroflexota bacterium]